MPPDVKQCCVPGCKSVDEDSNITFFKFPKEHERRLPWLWEIAREDLADKNHNCYAVCELHFKPQDILCCGYSKTLKDHAVPSLNLSAKPPEPNVGTSVRGDTNEDQPACSRSIDKKIEVIKKDLQNEKGVNKLFLKLCQIYLPKDLGELAKAHNYLKRNMKKSRMMAFKKCCLNLYYTSPHCYLSLQKLIGLPSRISLTKINIPMCSLINEDLISILKIKVNHMTEDEKQCCVVAGVMLLKSSVYYNISQDQIIGFHDVNGAQAPGLAKYAMVLIVRGIISPWMQPIGYAFLELGRTLKSKNINDVSSWIHKAFSILLGIGLKPRAYVADVGIDLLYKNRQISAEHPYFYINGHKIYYLFDVPQLMKFMRNTFLACNISYLNGCVAEFDFIVKLKDLDKCKTYKFASKLTDSHLNPKDSEKTETRLAVQLFSKSVASGILAYVDFKVMDESASETARFVQMMNDLFDILNSSTHNHEYKYKKAFTGDSFQTEFLDKIVILLKSLGFSKRSDGAIMKNVKIVNDFLTTINATRFLFNDLQMNGHKYVFTRCLNQDVVQDVISAIRNESGTEEPTPRQFKSIFQKLCFKHVLKTYKKKHSADDMSRFLLRLTDFLNIDESCYIQDRCSSLSDIRRVDYKSIVIPRENPLVYVCGWLLSKCAKVHNRCEELKNYMDVNKTFNSMDPKTRFSKYREYLTTMKTDLPAPPPDDFISYVDLMENVLRGVFQNVRGSLNIGFIIYGNIQKLDNNSQLPCTCFPKEYAQKLFIRMRIFTVLKHISMSAGLRNNLEPNPNVGPRYLHARTC